MGKKPMILLSGGLDSAVMVALAKEHGLSPMALHLTWGQPAWDLEVAAARRVCAAFRVPLLTAAIDVPPGPMQAGVGAPGPRVVPARNLLFVSLGAAWAVPHGCGEVWLGATGEDQADYPDCRPAFVAAADDLLRLTAGVGVVAPLIGMDGPALRAAANRLGVTPGMTWSCYQPSGRLPCGQCAACLRRAL